MVLWVRKYRPESVSEIPQNAAVRLVDFVKGFRGEKKKALFIHGPPGVGKTAAVCALADDLGLELAEVNASDFRTADQIHFRIGNALGQMSLFSSGKLVLVDELDGISGHQDRGGIQALEKLIKTANFPVVLIANDPWDKRLSGLRKLSLMLEFGAVSVVDIVGVLRKVLDKEGFSCDSVVLKKIARRSGGDLRAALMDLQVLAESGSFSLDDVDCLGDREHSESVVDALVRIFKPMDPSIAISAFDSVGDDVDACFLWVEENLPHEYRQPGDLERAYEALSRADVFRGRVRRRQYWRFLVYVRALISAGVAVAKDKKSPGLIKYVQSKRLLTRWILNQKFAKRKRVVEKLSEATHSSERSTVQDTFPFIYHVFQLHHHSSVLISNELGLDPDEVAWLEK